MLNPATLKRGDKLRCVGGSTVTFIAHIPEAAAPHQIAVLDADGNVELYWNDGRYHHSRVRSSLDLLIEDSQAHRLSQ